MRINLVLLSVVCWLSVFPFRCQAAPTYRSIEIKVDRPGEIHISGFNDVGQVIGCYYTEDGQQTLMHAFLWEKGKTIDLGSLPGDSGSVAHAINNSGQIVGTSTGKNNSSHAFVWERGKMRALESGENWSDAYAINNRGQIAGNSASGTTMQQPVIWYKGKRTDLALPHSTRASDGIAIDGINDRGQVIGFYIFLFWGPEYAFWGQNGELHDLDTDENVLTDVLAINRKGTIIGKRQLPNRNQMPAAGAKA